MNKILPLVSIIALPMVTLHAQANSGTISFSGMVTDSTCTVEVDGKGSNATILLPTVSKTVLSAIDATAGKTGFNIVMKDCTLGGTPADTQVSTYFEAGPTVDINTGLLINTIGTGAATNVALQLLDGTNDKKIEIGRESQTAENSYATVAGTPAATATLPYAVQYIATTGAATAGTVTSSVTYNVMYK
ncbi:fimbrial protein [Vibrio sp. VB16]|uniref:fimbrial protein n=1 Tax=Vibrio sp. VB16 TaxID=2785746 RepID=UPI00189E57DB|nr:fimbrial protein [Vibrio sp. VB16]UGA53577.1 type 1 fimbrial protein [Vibrio sp. VB16]